MYRNLEDSMFGRAQAKELYLFSDKTQKEIGDATGVSDRTIRDWIKRFRWNELKHRINNPPATLTEGIGLELTNLQYHILSKDCGFPNKDEVNVMHRLILCLEKLTKLPQHDHTIQPITDSEPDSLASPSLTGFPQGNERSSGEGLLVSSAFVDNSQTILPPPVENQPTTAPQIEVKAEVKAEPSGTEAEPSPDKSRDELMSSDLNVGTNNKKHSPGEGNSVISTASPERSAEQTENNPNSGHCEERSNQIPDSQTEPLTYREKMWELAKKEAKENGLWQPRSLPSNLLEPGTPEWEEREKRRLAAITQTLKEMRREQYNSGKRNNDW